MNVIYVDVVQDTIMYDGEMSYDELFKLQCDDLIVLATGEEVSVDGIEEYSGNTYVYVIRDPDFDPYTWHRQELEGDAVEPEYKVPPQQPTGSKFTLMFDDFYEV